MLKSPQFSDFEYDLNLKSYSKSAQISSKSTYANGFFVDWNPSVAAFFFPLDRVAGDRSASVVRRRFDLQNVK